MALSRTISSSIPAAQGPSGSEGQYTPGTSAPNPATNTGATSTSSGYTAPSSTGTRRVVSSGSTIGSTPSAPPGVAPLVNRDGSIPDPVATSAGYSAPASAGSGFTFKAIDPAGSMSLTDAKTALERMIGRALTPSEVSDALRITGLNGTESSISGDKFNLLLQEAQKRTPGSTYQPWGTSSGGGGGDDGGDGGSAAGWWEQFAQSQLGQPPIASPNVNPQVAAAINSLLMGVLQNPYSMSPQVVAQMKEGQKEQGLTMLQQLTNANRQDAASRGMEVSSGYGPGSGYTAHLNRELADRTTQGITKAYRDIDIAKSQQDRQDVLAAMGIADNLMGNQFTRDLSGAQFQASQRNAALQNALQGWQIGTQRDLGNRGLDLDAQRLEEMARQFNLSFQGRPMDWVSVLNDMVMGRANYGVNLAQLQQMGQNSLWNFIFGGQ